MKSIEEIAAAIVSTELTLKDIDGLRPIFSLHPPKGGFKKSPKKGIKEGGELGYRDDISSLIIRMI